MEEFLSELNRAKVIEGILILVISALILRTLFWTTKAIALIPFLIKKNLDIGHLFWLLFHFRQKGDAASFNNSAARGGDARRSIGIYFNRIVCVGGRAPAGAS